MARTFKAEGRQIANILRGLFIIGGLSVYFSIPGLHWGFFFGILFGSIIVADIIGSIWTRKRRSAKKEKVAKESKSTSRKVNGCRSDEIILTSKLDDLSGAEFERLLALYFRDQGYQVNEVGVGGNDGGVDLVIIDSRGEKTAVQAKCYSEQNISVTTVRELVAAKRNHDCILSLLVTTSDLTLPAKQEAEKFKVEYWHGAIVKARLKEWSKWQPGKRPRSTENRNETATKREIQQTQKEIASTYSLTCKCGAPMVRRKGKYGEFLGCSKFPSCKFTRVLQ